MKAAKSDIVFRMVDSFNRNTVQATVSWALVDHHNGPNGTLNCLPGLFVINRFFPTILFSIEMKETEYDENNDARQICITFFNTSAVKDIRSVKTCIKFLDSMLRRCADVDTKEEWSDELPMEWKIRDGVDQVLLNRMLELGDESRTKLHQSPTQCRIFVTYSRSSLGMSFENLPLMSIILKKVSTDYPNVIYSVERVVFNDQRCTFLLLFSEDNNWVKILNGYESNIEVCREEAFVMTRVNSQPVLLDL